MHISMYTHLTQTFSCFMYVRMRVCLTHLHPILIQSHDPPTSSTQCLPVTSVNQMTSQLLHDVVLCCWLVNV